VSADESLFERIAAGEPTAVRDCMDRYGGLVWTLVRSWIRNPADAEDATQEIFVDLWKSAARFDRSAGSEAVFVTTIARRRLIDRLRAQGRRPKTEEFDEESSAMAEAGAGPDVSQTVEVENAARALAALGAEQREILLMGVVQGMTHSEIARVTGKPLGTVKTQLRRGLKKVRALLHGEAEVGEDGGS
jgi:RNA polymerase sigma-70 factor (ECF subfamily)